MAPFTLTIPPHAQDQLAQMDNVTPSGPGATPGIIHMKEDGIILKYAVVNASTGDTTFTVLENRDNIPLPEIAARLSKGLQLDVVPGSTVPELREQLAKAQADLAAANKRADDAVGNRDAAEVERERVAGEAQLRSDEIAAANARSATKPVR